MCTAIRVCVLGYTYVSMSRNTFEKSHEFDIMSMIMLINNGLFSVYEYRFWTNDLTEAVSFSTNEKLIKNVITVSDSNKKNASFSTWHCMT